MVTEWKCARSADTGDLLQKVKVDDFDAVRRADNMRQWEAGCRQGFTLSLEKEVLAPLSRRVEAM